MRKIIQYSFIFVTILFMMSACIFNDKVKNPLLENEAFEIIGDQGFLDNVTLDDLQGDYSCTLWFVEYEKNQYSEDEFDCIGKISGNELIISWQMEGKTYTFGEGIQFKLEDSIMSSDESENPKLICAVKVYPSGHMVDGLGILEMDEIGLVRIHFQIVQ